MKWCIEYSEEQDEFHIQSSEYRFKNPINGYSLLAYYDSEEEANEFLYYFIHAHDHLAELKRRRITELTFWNRLLATEELLANKIVYENMEKSQAYQYIHKIAMELTNKINKDKK